jgi:transposase-like protein
VLTTGQEKAPPAGYGLPLWVRTPMERLMADAIVPVLCPNCGKENAITLRDGEKRSTLEHLCVSCAEKFTVNVDEMRKQAADVAKTAGKAAVQSVPGTKIG